MQNLTLASAAVLFALGLAGATPARADLDAGSCTDAQKSETTTSHTAQIGGKSIAYSATTGFIEVTSADKSAKACIFYTAYTVTPAAASAPRPLTFAFNGGPGSASLWLHLGFMGPKRVDMGPEGLTVPSSLALIPNDSSPLDTTDIVMIDPVATGFSHTEGQAANDKFFGVRNDYISIAAFIQNYLNANSRWASPKFILGESYGGIRGSLLANYLQSALNIEVAGVILISPALSSVPFFGATDDLVPYWTHFPSFAATAWFHKRISAKYQALDVADVYARAKVFAEGPYRAALEQGNQLGADAFDSVAAELAEFTGFSKEEINQRNLRLTDQDIFSDLLAAQGQTVGRYDSRFVAATAAGESEQDPSGTQPGFAFVAGINEYLRTDLGFNLPSPYKVFAEITSWPGDSDERLPNAMYDLAQALSDNANLRVLIASGYFDLACPMGTVTYEINQMPGGRDLAKRIEQKKFFGGHMMYINPPALVQLKAAVAEFITR